MNSGPRAIHDVSLSPAIWCQDVLVSWKAGVPPLTLEMYYNTSAASELVLISNMSQIVINATSSRSSRGWKLSRVNGSPVRDLRDVTAFDGAIAVRVLIAPDQSLFAKLTDSEGNWNISKGMNVQPPIEQIVPPNYRYSANLVSKQDLDSAVAYCSSMVLKIGGTLPFSNMTLAPSPQADELANLKQAYRLQRVILVVIVALLIPILLAVFIFPWLHRPTRKAMGNALQRKTSSRVGTTYEPIDFAFCPSLGSTHKCQACDSSPTCASMQSRKGMNHGSDDMPTDAQLVSNAHYHLRANPGRYAPMDRLSGLTTHRDLGEPNQEDGVIKLGTCNPDLAPPGTIVSLNSPVATSSTRHALESVELLKGETLNGTETDSLLQNQVEEELEKAAEISKLLKRQIPGSGSVSFDPDLSKNISSPGSFKSTAFHEMLEDDLSTVWEVPGSAENDDDRNEEEYEETHEIREQIYNNTNKSIESQSVSIQSDEFYHGRKRHRLESNS